MSSTVRVWIAGPRSWENPKPIEVVVRRLISSYGIGRLLVMTGGAPGVDTIAEQICNQHGVHVFACRACWPIGRAAGPIRNGVIAKEFEPAVLIALHYFPLDLTNHRGTQSAIKQAKRYGIHTKVLRVKPHVALPSSVAQDSPMGNRARREQGLPPKEPKAKQRRAKRSRDA